MERQEIKVRPEQVVEKALHTLEGEVALSDRNAAVENFRKGVLGNRQRNI